MATKKPSPKAKAKAKAKAAAPAPQPGRLQNLAARPTSFNNDALLDEDQLVDASGVFRVTSAISQAQIGHGEDAPGHFASDSLVMAAQRDGFRERGTSLDAAADEHAAADDATAAERRTRIATLAARNAARTRR
ncbi:MAG: hypothetical protein KIT31_21575 [Deltaproteobacteria bacterium]|nr:hypothetical protein [Deltaproteobacteria bacterium]